MISYGIKGQPKLSKRLQALNDYCLEVYKMELADFLVKSIPQRGLTDTCALLGVTPGHMNRWLYMMGLRKEVVLLKPGEYVEVHRQGEPFNNYSNSLGTNLIPQSQESAGG